MHIVEIIKLSIFSFSLEVIMLFTAIKLNKRNAVLSGCMGVIIFSCIKSMLIECGWEFAAIFGVIGGVAAEIIIYTSAIVLFRELLSIEKEKKFNNISSAAITMTMVLFSTGNRMFLYPENIYDYNMYMARLSLYISLTTASLIYISYSTGKLSDVIKLAAETELISFMIFMVLMKLSVSPEPAAAVLTASGASGILLIFVREISKHILSAKWFAGGLFLALICGLC